MTTGLLDRPTNDERPSTRSRLVAALAVGAVAGHLATSALYGLHRDEFYYLACGRHLAWGYVDQPPLTPLLYRLSEVLFGPSIVGLHILPSALAGAFVLLAALLARQLGGGRTAQGIAALVAALGPMYLTPTHFLSTVSIDLLVWAIATSLVIRMLQTGDQRMWVPIGAVVGLGFLNKYTVAFWVIGMAVGLVTGPRRLLWSRWLVVGIAIAVVLVAPNVMWEATHHWAGLEFMSHLRHRTLGINLATFVPIQLGLATPAGFWVWRAGVRSTLRHRPEYRALGVAFVTIVVLVFVTGGKGYYAGSIYLPVIAAGAVSIERTWSPHRRRRLTMGIVATGALLAPLFTPMVPLGVVHHVPLQDLNSDLSAVLGWHGVAVQVGEVAHGLAPAEQRVAVVLTANYSEAGAVDYWRSNLDLPPAISGHNNYWWWGWGRAGDGPVITVGIPAADVTKLFAETVLVGHLGGHGVLLDTQEQGAPIYVCRHPREPWARLWPLLRTYA